MSFCRLCRFLHVAPPTPPATTTTTTTTTTATTTTPTITTGKSPMSTLQSKMQVSVQELRHALKTQKMSSFLESMDISTQEQFFLCARLARQLSFTNFFFIEGDWTQDFVKHKTIDSRCFCWRAMTFLGPGSGNQWCEEIANCLKGVGTTKI